MDSNTRIALIKGMTDNVGDLLLLIEREPTYIDVCLSALASIDHDLNYLHLTDDFSRILKEEYYIVAELEKAIPVERLTKEKLYEQCKLLHREIDIFVFHILDLYTDSDVETYRRLDIIVKVKLLKQNLEKLQRSGQHEKGGR